MRLVLVPLALIGVVAALGVAARDDGQAPVSQAEARLVEVGAFDKPVHVASPPGDERLFVVEQAGRVHVLVEGRTLPRPFLDISRDVSTVGFEEGLLSLAFAPDYARSGRFYVDYTDHRSRTVVEEFRVSADPNVADPRSRRQVLVVANASRNHHGGHILFGPDGRLWISQGEGTTSFATFDAQRIDTLHGKILRIDPRPRGGRPYGIPPDNPFVGRAGRDEVWAYGLRNPWRIAFEPETGALLIGDVGRLSAEEIDVAQRPGLNFGWNCFEGGFPIEHDRPVPPTCAETVPPALELTRGSSRLGGSPDAAPTVTRGRPRVDARLRPGDPGCSITLGVFVGDPALPGLAGRHLFGDFCGPSLRTLRLDGGEIVDVRRVGLDVPLTSSFGVDSSGRVYVTSLLGPVYRLEPR